MPMTELARWQQYAAVEPFGSHYDDLRAGSIVAAVYNVNRDRKKCPEAFAPLEFMPWNSRAPKLNEPILHADPQAQSLAIQRLIGQGKP